MTELRGAYVMGDECSTRAHIEFIAQRNRDLTLVKVVVAGPLRVYHGGATPFSLCHYRLEPPWMNA